MIPCSDLLTDISDIAISRDQLSDAICLEFPKDIKFGGNFIDQFQSSIHINVRPCIPSPPDLLCQVQRYKPDGSADGPPVSTIDVSSSAARTITSDLLREFAQDFSLEFGMVEDSPNFSEFEKPMIRYINSENHLKINSGYGFNHGYYLSQVEVHTGSGFFLSKKTLK